MKTKDRVIIATDMISAALQGIVRINYANEKQTEHNVEIIVSALLNAATVLNPKQVLKSSQERVAKMEKDWE